MHRAIERAMMKTLHARPADPPRNRPGASDGADAPDADRAVGPRAELRQAVTDRGGRTGKTPRGQSPGGRRDARS
jgi:hypothetical protein